MNSRWEKQDVQEDVQRMDELVVVLDVMKTVDYLLVNNPSESTDSPLPDNNMYVPESKACQ